MNHSLTYLLPVLSLVAIAVAYVIKQNRTKAHLINTANRLYSLLSISQDAVILLESDDAIHYMNEAMARLLKIDGNKKYLVEADMPNIYFNNHPLKLKDFIQEVHRPASSQNELSYYPNLQIETRKLNKTSVDLYLGQTYSPEMRSDQYIIVIRDLRELLEQVASGERDPLTHLPSRAKAYRDYQMLCSKHHLTQNKVALMAISIDDFLVTQSLLGHEESDKTILEVSRVLTHLSLLHSYNVYHLTYATFLFVFSDVQTTDELLELAQTIQDALARLYVEHKSAAYLTASISIATTPESGDIKTLFDKCHEGLIEARKYGVGNAYLCQKTNEGHAYSMSELQHDIQYAIDRKELMIFYQPIVDAKTHKVVAAEALMRWKHPAHGLIPPFLFIPLMEKTGFIVEAGRYLIKEVIHQQAKWKEFGFEEITVSLNASMREVESKGYVSYVSEQLKKYQVRPNSIKIEITESLAMGNAKKMFDTLAHLRGAGVLLSLDDFGTGYTSFAYLTKIPANTLKIDKSFIDEMLQDDKSQQVVHAIIEVGHALEMDIVAEGVETAQSAQRLVELGCDYLQGYYFDKPLPGFEMQGKLQKVQILSKENSKQGHGEDLLPIYNA